MVPVHDPDAAEVAHARAVMLAERADITARVGLRFVIMRCLCGYEADGIGNTEGQAMDNATADLIRHLQMSH